MATTVTAPESAHSEMFTDSSMTKMLMSSEKCAEQSEDFSWKEKLYRFILIAGSRYALVTLSILIHALIFLLGLMHYANDIDGFKTLKTTSVALMVADASTLVLHFDLAVILLPVSYHKLVAWSMVFFTWVHAIAHWINFIQLASKNGQGPKGFFLTCLTTGSGWSGHIMLFLLMIVAATSTERIRVLKWQRFWSTHHLFILFFVFWSIHGTFSTTREGKAMTWTRTATFWQYWLIGGLFYLVEKALREVRGKHKTHISKVVQHPSNVVEIQIKKRQTTVKIGQHIYLCCPEISVWQWRTFVLTSAPEEDYLAVHIHCNDQFSRSLATSVGCSFEYPKDSSSVETSLVVGIDEKAVKLDIDPSVRSLLPPVSVDGPFGHNFDGLFEKEVGILVGVGHSVTALASILKSIWYRQNLAYEKTALRKVYVFWLCDDMTGFEWFKALIMAIEAQDMDSSIEVHPYFTSSYKSIVATDAAHKATDASKDIFAGLRSPTVFGQPNWDAIFRAITKLHSYAKRGVFPCGPPELMSDLLVISRRYAQEGLTVDLSEEGF